jgi:hypothetical protein
MVANHINEGPGDNCSINLEWLSPAENNRAVQQFTIDGDLIAEYASAKVAENGTSVCRTRISAACRGERKSSDGFIWKFVKPEFTAPTGQTKRVVQYDLESAGD